MHTNTMLRDIKRETDAWQWIGATFQRGSAHCETCPHCRVTVEYEPYQEGWAPRAYTECVIHESRKPTPTDCPAWAEHLEEA